MIRRRTFRGAAVLTASWTIMLVAALGAAACAVAPPMPEPLPTHPASPAAAEVARPARSARLRVAGPPADTRSGTDAAPAPPSAGQPATPVDAASRPMAPNMHHHGGGA